MSDLHFGRTRPELLDPLLTAVNDAAPHLVVISGDLTQRARHSQFEQARAFIDRIEAPSLIVPGNHDIPLYNPLLRWITPFARYRRWIGDQLEPEHNDPQMRVAGLNTVNPYSGQRGLIRPRAVMRVCQTFAETGPINILVAHHPLEQGPDARKKLMRGASGAIDRLAGCGADIVLSGHLHSWNAAPFVSGTNQRRMLQLHVGTGLSTRLRDEPNDFAILTLDGDEAVIQRMTAEGETPQFRRATTHIFRRSPAGWAAIAPG